MNRKAYLILLAILLPLCVARTERVLAENPDFLLMPSENAMHVIVPGLPRDGVAGFDVYRADDGSSDYKKINAEPITKLEDEEEILTLLGDGTAKFFKTFEITSTSEIFEKYPDQEITYDITALFSLEINVLLGRYYEDKEVEPEATYSYYVTLVDDSGSEVERFEPIKTTVVPPVITVPIDFRLETKDGRVDLKWEKEDEGTFRGNGWNVYRSSASKDGPFEKINHSLISTLSATKDSFTLYPDMLLENGTTYYYYVAGTDLVGNDGLPTEVLEAKPRDMTPPKPPTGIEVEQVETEDKKLIAVLTWKMNLEPDLASYDVHIGETKEGDFTKITEEPLSIETVTYTIPGLREGKTTFYRLTANDTSNNASQPSISVSLLPPDKTPPDSPIQFEGKPSGNDMILLNWEINKEEDLFGYFIFRGKSPEKMIKINPTVVDAEITEFKDYTVETGQKYFYSLAAVDESDNLSKQSTVIMVVAPDAVPPDFPSSLFAVAEDHKVTVTWPANTERDLAGYFVYRTTTEDAPETEFEKIEKEFTKEDVEFIDLEVKNGVKYWYYATAFDTSDNESERSSIVVAYPRDFEPPLSPVGIAGVATETELTLTWTPNEEKDLKGYGVLRSATRTGIYEPISGEKIISLEKTEYIDKTLEKEKTYWYRVIAWDTSINKSNRSMAAGPFQLKAPEEAALPEKDGESNKDGKPGEEKIEEK